MEFWFSRSRFFFDPRGHANVGYVKADSSYLFPQKQPTTLLIQNSYTQNSTMTAQSESQFKHNPDDWSLTSEYYCHVEHVVQPLIAELAKWVCLFQRSFEMQAVRNL